MSGGVRSGGGVGGGGRGSCQCEPAPVFRLLVREPHNCPHRAAIGAWFPDRVGGGGVGGGGASCFDYYFVKCICVRLIYSLECFFVKSQT